MFTTEGKNHVRRYLAQYVPQLAGGMAFGIGNRIEQGADINLHFEVIRSEIKVVRYDFAANKLIFTATVPLEYGGMIYEVGLLSSFNDAKNSSYGTKIITTFNPNFESWVDNTTSTAEAFTTTNSRIDSGLSHTPAASTTKVSALRAANFNLLGYDNSDFITIAMNIGNTFTQSIKVTFLTNATNYFEYTLTGPVQTSGYKIFELLKGAATAVGSPDWATISEVRVTTTSTGLGQSNVLWDGILAADNNTNLDYVLVARKVLDTPLTSVAGQTQDVEFSMDITI